MNLQDPTVLKYYNTAGRTVFFVLLLLLFELLCLSKDTSFVLARSTSTPFVMVLLKGEGGCLCRALPGAAFSVFGKAGPRSQSAESGKKGQEEGKLFPGASAAMHC